MMVNPSTWRSSARAALVLPLVLWAVTGCSRPQVNPKPGDVPAATAGAAAVPASAASPAEGAAQAPSPARGDTVYVDVRTPEEFAAGHVAGALNIPHDQMEQRWAELEKYRDRPLVLYCRSGHRAGLALQVLQAHGFTTASNAGGLDALRQRGVPVAQ